MGFFGLGTDRATMARVDPRAHWQIEKGSHYVRDMTFAEDASRIRKNPDIVARMRSFAYNLLRSQGIDNMKNARWRAALDLNQVLEITGLLLRTEQPWWMLPAVIPCALRSSRT